MPGLATNFQVTVDVATKHIYEIIPSWSKAGRDLRVMIIGKVVCLTPYQVWSDHTTVPKKMLIHLISNDMEVI